MSMGTWDSIKDWASKKLASSEFVTYVEQATNQDLLQPNYDMFMVLVDAANDPRGEWVNDVVRSVRIRMDVANPKVKLFTIELISVLVQNCGLRLHEEVAASKGLLNAIVELACMRQDLVRGPLQEARKSAIQLIVNMDVWFKHHPAKDKVLVLANLITDARNRGCIFENVLADAKTQICTEKFPRRSQGDPERSGNEIMGRNAAANSTATRGGQQQHSQAAQRRAAYEAQQQRRGPIRDELIIVEAIPVEEPNEERRAGMFDAVMLLGEMFHAAKAAGEAIGGNDTVMALSDQVQQDFQYVSMLVHSGANLEQRDVLASLFESQRTMLAEVSTARGGGAAPSSGGGIVTGGTGEQQSVDHHHASQPPGQGAMPGVFSGQQAQAGWQPGQNQPMQPQAGVMPQTNQAQPPAQPAPAKKTAPTLDELFATAAPATQDNNNNNNNNNTTSNNLQPPPGHRPKQSSGIDSLFSNPVSPNMSGPVTANNNALPTSIPTTLMGGTGGGNTTARRSAMPEPQQNMNHGQRNDNNTDSTYTNRELVEMDQELHTPKEGESEMSPKPADIQASLTGNTNNNDAASRNATTTTTANNSAGARTAADTEADFDAFLNSRLSIQNQ